MPTRTSGRGRGDFREDIDAEAQSPNPEAPIRQEELYGLIGFTQDFAL